MFWRQIKHPTWALSIGQVLPTFTHDISMVRSHTWAQTLLSSR
jgi:hypothetical protein